ncbi:DUF697 domain-containing protein [Chitinimonas koreensis]|uniref:DUF697 domain-containing protein n=1 Tax=Chitinimonas koreensis TaxID=356302 RepID=UPI00040F7C3A|nr:DUF697 domain-containing protein [Chitinimonas koreensis]QNM98738.1 DUF697 domain-containing protein [Chitinimonas koreensis]
MVLPQNHDELERARADCRELVSRRAGISAGAAVIPLPGVDMLADVAVFSEMLETISHRFGLSQAELARLHPHTRQYVILAAGRVGSDLIGKLVSKQLAKLVLKKVGKRFIGKTVLRFVPLAGQAVAAAISYQVVAKLGRDHIEDCYRVARSLLEQGMAGTVPLLPAPQTPSPQGQT